MINSANEYEPDVLNTFCVTRAWKRKILQGMFELISTFATQLGDFAVFERQFLLEYYTERAKHFNMQLISLTL